MTRKLNLKELEGRIERLRVLRSESEDTDTYVSYTLQLRHYRGMYERAKLIQSRQDKTSVSKNQAVVEVHETTRDDRHKTADTFVNRVRRYDGGAI